MEVSGAFAVARGDAPVMLEFTEEAFNPVAVGIKGNVAGAEVLAV